MENDKQYFNVEIFGDYFVSTSEGNVVRPFGPVVLRMRLWQQCQSLARFHIVPNLLRKADPEFRDIRRCIVLGVKTADNGVVYGLPIKFMSLEQITLEIKSNSIPLLVDMYPDIIQLRNKLYMARENPEKFKKQEQRSIQSFSKIGDALELNADVFKKVAQQNEPSDNANLLNRDNQSAKETYTPNSDAVTAKPANLDNLPEVIITEDAGKDKDDDEAFNL